jgi:subtilisin
LSDGDLDRVHTVETSFPSVPGVSYVRVLVGFSHTPQVAEIGLMQKNSGVIKYIYHLVPAIAAQIPKNNLYALLKEPLVKVVEPDRNAFKRDDFDYSWPLNVMHVQPLQNLGFTGKNVRVAILDTGVDYTHPDIAHAYAGGHDFVHNTDTPMDDNGHGTHVAGIIVGPSSTTTSEGVAPDIRLYALKVLNAEGSGMFSDIIAGLEWAVDHHMQIANESFGTSEDPGMIVRDAFQNANDAGLLSIVAAGNDGSCALYAPATTARTNTVEYPGRFPSTIAVAAVDINGNHACFSSSGPDVELAAPGFVIKSAKNGGGWSLKSGTSSAAPYVTGIAALILSAGLSDTNGDGRVNDELRVVLDGSVKSRGGGRTPMYGYGVLDASKAVSLLSAPNTANNP